MKNRPYNPDRKKYVHQHNLCELCGRDLPLEIHHIIPVCVGGRDIERNWIAICPACHRKLTPSSELCSVTKRQIALVRKFWLNFFEEIDACGDVWDAIFFVENETLSKGSFNYKKEKE